MTERLKKEKEEQERRHLEEMSEDEYDALTEQKKAEVDRQRLVIKKERLKRYFLLFNILTLSQQFTLSLDRYFCQDSSFGVLRLS